MKLKDNELLIGMCILLIILFSLLFGFTGFRFSLGFILIFILPIYLLLNSLNLDLLEKIVYSFFLGIGIVPTFVYYLGIVVSFRLAIAVVFVVLLTASFLLKKHRSNPAP